MCDATGIESQSNATWSVYPNPLFSAATFHFNTILKDATFTVYNACGKHVLSIINISGQTIELQRDNLSGGVYLVRLMQENKIIATDKLVIMD